MYGRAGASLASIAILMTPIAIAAQDAAAVAAVETTESWPEWLQALFFIASLPYTLFMVFAEGQKLHLLPAPLLGIGLCLWSFREWRRQRFWTPRIIHILAAVGLATIILINVDWVLAGGAMWTQRYVVIAIFALFPYAAYLLFLGPKFIGRKRAVVSSGTAAGSDDPMGVPPTVPDRSRQTASEGGRTSRSAAWFVVLGMVTATVVGVFVASGSSAPVSEARPDLEALLASDSLVPGARGVTRGDPGARFKILVFGDYQCPACEYFARNVQARVDSAYVEPGRAELVFFDLPLTSIHANAFLAARAAHCAEDQDGFWAYQKELFRRQREWSELAIPDDSFEDAAEAVGLDPIVFRSCLDSDRHTNLVEANRELAFGLGIKSTPTVVVTLADAVPRKVNRHSFRSIAHTVETMDSISAGER
jgi:protein-disulfide isomerase